MLTLVVTYYQNPTMLRRHIAEWRKYPDAIKPSLKAIIVDDGSPKAPAAEFVDPVGFPITVYRVDVDIPWNQDGARNLAMMECETGWALLADVDHLLPAHQAAGAVHMDRERGEVYRPGQYRPDGNGGFVDRGKRHPNTFVFHRDDFWTMGGYDEDFAGYWGSDKNFVKCVAAKLKFKLSDDFYLVAYREGEVWDCKTRGLGRRGGRYHLSPSNPVLMADRPWLIDKARGPAYIAENPIRFPWSKVLTC